VDDLPDVHLRLLCGLMGLALAQLSRFMVRVGERIDELDVE
jgi:hypothetical protein